MNPDIKTIIKSNDMESRLQAAVFMVRLLNEKLQKTKELLESAKKDKRYIIDGYISRFGEYRDCFICYECNEWCHMETVIVNVCVKCKIEVCYDCVEAGKNFNLWEPDESMHNPIDFQECNNCYAELDK